jgi:hypothetical protein
MKKKSLQFAAAFTSVMLVTNVLAQTRFDASWPDTNFDNLTIELNEVMSGGPPKDGIPAIDDPKFDNVKQAAKWLDPREPVIRVTHAGEARAYPLQLLIYHEIVNDQIGDLPISVTFCPLCNSSVVFDRRLDGRLLDFGTTGMLRKSDMVMYDRQTESWWQQIIGKGIVGEYAGVSLTQVPSNIVSFEDFAQTHPDGKVVNRETGHSRPYGNNPYRGYDAIDNSPFLFRGEIDPRLPPMERVMHIEANGGAKLYPFSSLKDKGVVNDTVSDTPIVLFSRAGLLSVLDAGSIKRSREIQAVTAFARELNGQTLEFKVEDGKITDQQTGSSWNTLGAATAGELKGQTLAKVNGGIHFAFAWLAFNPDVEMYQ